MKLKILIVCLFMLSAIPAFADDLQIIVGGKALHVGTDELNESNYGLGLQYDFKNSERWIPVINLASFKDSSNNTSRYIGSGIKRRYRIFGSPNRTNFDVGAIALVMTRPDYNDDQPFFGTIPFISLTNEWGGINMTYIPKLEEDMYPFWYFQLSFKLFEI